MFYLKKNIFYDKNKIPEATSNEILSTKVGQETMLKHLASVTNEISKIFCIENDPEYKAEKDAIDTKKELIKQRTLDFEREMGTKLVDSNKNNLINI